MKKLLFLGLLSLAALNATASSAPAWFLGCCCHRCNDCATTIRIRPYNAFSPTCCGTIDCVGCCPGLHCGPQGAPSCFGRGCAGPSCFASGCCDFGCLPAPGSFGAPVQGGSASGVQVMPGQPANQANPGPVFAPPAPQSINPTAYIQQMQYLQYMQQMQMIQQLQQGGYQPAYNPYASQQAPSYWYGR